VSKNWEELTNEDLLNLSGNQSPEVIARYQRIMDKKIVDALGQVWAGLFDLKKTMHSVTDKLEARLVSAEETQRQAALSQGNLQRVTVALTIVIALSTVIYTVITWQSVQAQREANQIQRSAVLKSGIAMPGSDFKVGETYRFVGDGKFERQKVIDWKDLK